MKLNTKKYNKWLNWKKKWLFFSEGFETYANDKLFNYLHFDPNWANIPGGQMKLEDTRQYQSIPFEFESKRFAQLYTRKFKMYSFKGTLIAKKEAKFGLEDFVDKSFFDSVMLYGSLRTIYNFIADDKDITSHDVISKHLIKHFEYSLEKYFKRKKTKKKEWDKLNRYEKLAIYDQINYSIFANFKSSNFKVIKNINKKVYVDGKFENKSFIGRHPDFDKSILGEYPWLLLDLPCIELPKDWQLINEIAVNGGYHTYPTKFVNPKYNFIGEIKPTQNLLNILNQQQQTPWSIDPAAYNPVFLSKEFKAVYEYIEKNKKAILRSEDLLQSLNTVLFLRKFCVTYPKFYYISVIDMRGRVYTASDWGFSPTSSKYIRKAIRLPNPLNLTEDGINWIYLKIGRLLNIKTTSNLELLNKVKALPEIHLENKKFEDFPDYNSYYIAKLYNDIKTEISDEILDNDCTCNAYQLAAIMTRSEKLAYLTNLIGDNVDIGGPASPYIKQDLYNYVIEKCREQIPHVSMEALLTRTLMKSLIMPKGYGKSPKTSKKDITDFIYQTEEVRNIILNVPDDIILETIADKDFSFPDKSTNFEYYTNSKIYYYSIWFYNHFKQIFDKEFPEIQKLESLFRGSKAVLRNFTFQTKFLKFTNEYNAIDDYFIVREVNKVRTKMLFPYVTEDPDSHKNSTASLANFTHCLDAYVVHLVIEKMIANNIKIFTIHDNFKVHPNYINFLQESLLDAYQEVQNYIKTMPEFDVFNDKPQLILKSKNIIKLD